MRTETSVFKDPENENFSVGAYIVGGSIVVSVQETFDSGVSSMTKKQAAEFARQILEMCEESENE